MEQKNLIEILQHDINVIGGINVPIGLADSISRPLLGVLHDLIAVCDAVSQPEKPEEGSEE